MNEREKIKCGSSDKHYIYWRKERYIFGCECSQAVPARPSGKGRLKIKNVKLSRYPMHALRGRGSIAATHS
jgi:hypothetical protein